MTILAPIWNLLVPFGVHFGASEADVGALGEHLGRIKANISANGTVANLRGVRLATVGGSHWAPWRLMFGPPSDHFSNFGALPASILEEK